MTTEKRKEVLRFILQSIFSDDCQEIDDSGIIDFYFFLMNDLEIGLNDYLGSDDNKYFIMEVIVQTLSDFHKIDSSLLIQITRSSDNFREFVLEQTGFPEEFIEKSIELMIGNFQEIKQKFIFVKQETHRSSADGRNAFKQK